MRPPPPKNLNEGQLQVPMDLTTAYRAGWFGFKTPESQAHNENLFLRNKDGSIIYCPCMIWEHCRDVFQEVPDCSLLDNGMWYCHIQGQADNICAFIDHIENKISATTKMKRTQFWKTEYHNILWLQPSPLWIHNFMRRSFFTLALRCGQWYRRTKSNFYQAFDHYEESRECKPAINRLLDGYIYYAGGEPEFNIMGWSHHFSCVTQAEAEKMLI